MSVEFKDFSPNPLPKGPRTPGLVSGEELDSQPLELGFVDETGRVISGCTFVNDDEEAVEVPADIEIYPNPDETNDKSIIFEFRVKNSIRVNKVKPFLMPECYEIKRCAVDLDAPDPEIFLFQDWVYIS